MLKEFLRLEIAAGFLLFGAAVLGLVLANSPLSGYYAALLDTTMVVQIGGLLLGNPIGILLFTGAGVALGLTRLPAGVNWLQMAGAAFICGIGFTMSLFIAGLAFEHAGGAYYDRVRLGILAGSALAALAGCLALGFSADRSGKVPPA